jgi:hypothetical protein
VRQDAERTAKAIVAGTWGCALVVMGGSAINAFLAYGALGDNRALGLATGLAVDIGLCVALIGDRRLYAHGLSSNWGRALRLTTAGMSLVINTAIALRDGHYLMAFLHAFLPILLVVLTEYGQDVLLKFAAMRRDVEAVARDAARAATQPVPTPVPAPVPAFPAPAPLPPPAVPIAPAQRPTQDLVTQPAPTPPAEPTKRAAPPAAPHPTQDVDADLIARVRALHRDRDAKGLPRAGRRVLMAELGVTDRVARRLAAVDANTLEAVA